MKTEVWGVKLPDVPAVNLWDLYEVQAIADKHEMSWSQVVDNPLARLDIALDIVTAAAKARGVEAPKLEGSTPREILPFFIRIPDDVPLEFSDGVPPKGAGRKTVG